MGLSAVGRPVPMSRKLELVVNLGSALAPGEDGHMLHADGVDERVGMAVHQSPSRSFAPEDQGHAQRPVLVRHATYLAVLPLDRHEYRQVARRVCLDELQIRRTAPEHFGVDSSAASASKPRAVSPPYGGMSV
jgi:hypothetical protein